MSHFEVNICSTIQDTPCVCMKSRSSLPCPQQPVISPDPKPHILGQQIRPSDTTTSGMCKTFNGLTQQVTIVKCTASGVSYQKAVQECKFWMFSVQYKRCLATTSSKFCFRIYNYRILSKSEEYETAGAFRLLLQAYYYNSSEKTNIL